MKTIPYPKFGRQTKCIMGDSEMASEKEVRAHPSHLFLITVLYGATGFFWPSTDESTGVYNTPYVLTSEDRTLIKRVHLLLVLFILLFCKICSLYLTFTPSASRNLSKCRLHGFKMETSNSVHYLTNLRSTLLVTGRISCYGVACARLSESRDTPNIK